MSEQPDDWMPDTKAATVTNSAIYEQLIKSDGNMSFAARELGVSRAWLAERVARNVTLSAMMQDQVAEIVDIAQANTFADVRKNDPVANRFVLQTLGKDRGFSTGVVGSGKNGEIVVVINKLSGEPSDGA